jgi:hypothetical protein
VTLLAALISAGCSSRDITAPSGAVWDVTYTVTTVGDLRADTITYYNGTFRVDGAEVPAVVVNAPKVWSKRVFLPDSALAWISVDYGPVGGGSLTFDITYQPVGHPERAAVFHSGPWYFDALPRPTHTFATARFLALADLD